MVVMIVVRVRVMVILIISPRRIVTNGNCIIRKIVITNNNSHFNYMKILRIKNIDNNHVNVTIKES